MMERYLADLPIPVYIHLYPLELDFVPERLDENYAKLVHENVREYQPATVAGFAESCTMVEQTNHTK